MSISLYVTLFSFYSSLFFFFFKNTPPTEIYTLSLHDALPILGRQADRLELLQCLGERGVERTHDLRQTRSEEHTSELQSHVNLVCRLLLEKKKKKKTRYKRYKKY